MKNNSDVAVEIMLWFKDQPEEQTRFASAEIAEGIAYPEESMVIEPLYYLRDQGAIEIISEKPSIGEHTITSLLVMLTDDGKKLLEK
jgi:hypothetical protein